MILGVSAPRRPARAEVVGSLLRPRRLLQAAAELYEPGHTAVFAQERAKDRSALDEVLDQEVRAAVARQADLGLDVVTDGEFGRLAFTNSFYDAIEGIEPSPVPVRFRNAAGEKIIFTGVPRITGRLRKVDNPLAREAARLHAITDRPFKVTLPAASWFLPTVFFESGGPYASHDELLEDTLAVQRELIAEAIEAGARYVQLDFPSYVQLIDDGAREYAIVRQGLDPEDFLDRALDLDRRVIEGFPDEVTFGMHICRGNHRSMWIYEGSLEPVAERIFTELPYDVFLVEWDDPERAGDYGALRHVPRNGPIVVLGIVSSKHPPVETRDQLVREVERAARHVDVAQLAISPQCGFASTAEGNALAPDAQWAKLEAVAEAADEVWGRPGG
jgi:5-methyltetrahydropteroyltriglutamate--homocysteine methyltransferase